MSRILCDVDGVLGDFCGHALGTLKAVGHDVPTREDIITFGMDKYLNSRAKHAYKTLLRTTSFWEGIPPLAGAQEAIKALRRSADIWFVSSPYESCWGWDSARREWLKEHFDASAKDFFPAPQKQGFCGDLFIDDKYENIVLWAEEQKSINAFLFTQPYNKDSHWYYKLNGWTADNVNQILDFIS